MRMAGAEERMDVDSFRAWMTEAARLVDAEAARLTELDAAIGDGDHGTNLNRGLAAVLDALAGKDLSTPQDVLVTAGRALISKVGGAAGPLYGSALRRAGRALGDGRDVDAGALSDALRAALDGVRHLGGAVEGDKTMVDALAPAVAAYGEALADGAPVASATRAAAEAAAKGAEATVPMRAAKGRASYLGPRSVGHEDPGAASTALLLRALANVVAARE